LLTSCVAFAPIYDRAMQQALVDTLFDSASTADQVVGLQSKAAVNAIGTTEARDPRELQALLPPEVAARLAPSVLGRTALVTPAEGDVPPTGQLVWRDGACAHVRVQRGRCPDAAGEILVSDADAEVFALDVGSVLTTSPAEDGADIEMEVVGTYAPGDSTWWQGLALTGQTRVTHGTDPSATHDAWLTAEQTFDEAAVLPGETSQAVAPVLSTARDVDDVRALEARLRELARELRRDEDGVEVVDALDDVTGELDAQAGQARRTVPLLVTPMALLALVVLWLVLGEATQQRRGDVAVARLRGRGPTAAATLLTVELLPVLLAGVVPGAGLALLYGVVARAVLPGDAPFEAAPGFAWAVLLVVVALVGVTAATAVRVAREPLEALVRSGRSGSSRWRLGAADVVLLAASGAGVLAFATGSLTGPAALAGPALLALFVGLLLGHLVVPAASRLGGRLLERGRLVPAMTLLETARSRQTRILVAVATVACALAVFSVDAVAVGEHNRVNASEHDAGAPVVLSIDGHDLDGVRTALRSVDPAGRRTTPVVVAGDTLAVDPASFRKVAFFPRGAPTSDQWDAIAPPDRQPVRMTGSRLALTVRPGPGFTATDILGDDSDVHVALVVTSATGVRHTVPLGSLPPAGARARLAGNATVCADGCELAAVRLTAAQGVTTDGVLDLGRLRVDGRPVASGAGVDRWNTVEDEHAVLRPLPGTASGGMVGVQVGVRGFYPVDLTPAWVPSRVPALLTVGPSDPRELTVDGVDGSDRRAVEAGRLTLVPAMPRRAALVSLDALTRGSAFSFDSRLEVWSDDAPDLVAALRTSLRDGGIGVTGVRRHGTIRQSYDDTVATWSLGLGALLGPAVVVVALLVILILAVIGWRQRAQELAVLRLHGADRRTILLLAGWAPVPALVLAVVGGAAAGLLGARLAMPDVAFFPSPPATPVVVLSTAWPVVAAAVLACAVTFPLLASLTGVATARRAGLSRVGEEV